MACYDRIEFDDFKEAHEQAASLHKASIAIAGANRRYGLLATRDRRSRSSVTAVPRSPTRVMIP